MSTIHQQDSALLRSVLRKHPRRRAEYIYIDELLLKERRNLARRWWSTFGTIYGFLVALILLGWWRNGFLPLTQPDYWHPTVTVLAIPILGAISGFGLWFIWISQRPMRILHTQFEGKPKTAFRVALACVAEAGWTPWEIDYEHQVAVALAPTGAFDGIPPQVVTIFCAPIDDGLTEVRVQSRFIEATRIIDYRRTNQTNLKSFQRWYRRLSLESDGPFLPMPHPLARLKGKLPEEQELAIQALGRGRAQARLWGTWIFLSVLAAVMLQLQPWFNLAMAWPLTFLAAGFYHFLLGNQWSAQEQHALHHATATIIANPFARRSELWEAVDILAQKQRLVLHEQIDEDTRLYRDRQPAPGYPGTYLLMYTTRNDAGVEQVVAVAVPEWGLFSALMPTVYAPFHVLALMQALRRGPMDVAPLPARESIPSSVAV